MDENERKALKILIQTNQTLFLARKSNINRLNNFSVISDTRYERLKNLSIDSFDEPLSKLYEEITNSLHFFLEYENFLSDINEINIYDSALLIIYLGNVSRFKNKKHLISYAGLSPVFKYNNNCFKPKKYNNKGICVSNRKNDNIDYSEPLKNIIIRCTQKMIQNNKEWNDIFKDYQQKYQKKNPRYNKHRLELMSLKKTSIKFLFFIYNNFKKIQEKEKIEYTKDLINDESKLKNKK